MNFYRLHVSTLPKGSRFSRYNMKCCGENVILRGIFHVLSCFPLLFMLQHIAEIWIAFRTVWKGGLKQYSSYLYSINSLQGVYEYQCSILVFRNYNGLLKILILMLSPAADSTDPLPPSYLIPPKPETIFSP